MFAKYLSSLSLLALALSLPYQALGHAIITPALGVSGTPARSDVTKPSSASPCGSGVNVASALAGSTAVQATANAFAVTVTNFNGGKDGSTEITSSSVDPSGTGASFTGGSATITKNGVAAPATTGSVQVAATLPSGTTCTGGNDGASCLVSFTTAGGFGNCVLVSQGGAAAGGASAAAGAAAANGTTTDAAAATAAAKKQKNKGKGTKAAKGAAGARLARSLKIRAELGEAFEKKRSWVWAA
ncbi:hypothetical protein DFH11DRAFT_1598188 [Phellopilus nigrolimitatus]|nr:hypothetical protein DFH11DRAFT_1598188 [Phellopilus nigrolimitatus]